MNKIKKIIAGTSAGLLLLASSSIPAFAAIEPWNVTGAYDIGFQVTGDPTVYTHDANLVQTGSNVTGDGGYPAGGLYTYAWDVTAGSVSGNTISLTVLYDLGAIGTVMNMTGTIAPDGTMSGAWTDNFVEGGRTGTWSTSDGAAVRVTPNECGNLSFDNVVEGTNSSNVLIGTSSRDLILGWGGSDVLSGLGNNDCLVGGDGSDYLTGGAGDDVLLGENGSDSLQGGLGNDKLFGGASSDALSGESGNDWLDGQDGSDAANGGVGSDTCLAEAKLLCEL